MRAASGAGGHEPRRGQVLERGADRLEQRHVAGRPPHGPLAAKQLGQVKAFLESLNGELTYPDAPKLP